MNRIILNRDLSANCWTATFEGPHAAEIIELFGTATIPTAFTCNAQSTVVFREIKDKNPGCIVQAR